MASSKPLLLPSEMASLSLKADSCEAEFECKLSPEVEVIRKMREKLIMYIDPVHLIPCLPSCLTQMEEQEIEAKRTNEGPMRGCMLFLDKVFYYLFYI